MLGGWGVGAVSALSAESSGKGLRSAADGSRFVGVDDDGVADDFGESCCAHRTALKDSIKHNKEQRRIASFYR